MTNIQIKSEIKNTSNEVIDSTYTGLYYGCSPLENLYFEKKDFYLNLDLISSFRFDKIEGDLEVFLENEKTNSKNEIVLKKGMPFIELFTIREGVGIPYMMLVFPHKGEFHRIQRILTDDLCIK